MASLYLAVGTALVAAVAAQFPGAFPPFTFPAVQPFRPFPFPGQGGGGRGRQLSPSCGRVQSPPAFRFGGPSTTDRPRNEAFVVGGQPVRDGDWPWMVLLGERQGGRRVWTCGGTLLSARTVLTAAHCVSGRQPAALTARLGEFDTSRGDDGPHVDAAVATITVHPGYGGAARHDDIALLRLSRPVALGARVQPACLPPAGANHTGRTARVAGWGLTEFNGQSAAVLQEAALTVSDVNECEQSYRTQLDFFTRRYPGGFGGTKLCAAGDEKDSCEGDSGGPLTTPGADGRQQVIGVASTGFGCGLPGFPGIYTKVSQYISWIMQNAV
ncbi:venom protease-like [Amphibalanus amphitrite]|uniref:venom protease-like n=1 Tax=Amphibalanus amphitrite TaxID=1232801 RepID=UPI001C914AEA|nr:venom protease-like [Amphibalanus amphitrite]